MEDGRRFARHVMAEADAAYLTTFGADGYPRTRAILNLRNPSLYPGQAALFEAQADDFLIYVTTNTSSAKVAQIRRDPRGSVYYCQPGHYHGVLFVGDLEIIDDSTLRHALWNDTWTRYYPEGPDDPDHTILRLAPRLAEGWQGPGRFAFKIL